MLKTRYTQVYQRQPDGSFKIVHEHMSVAARRARARRERAMTGGCACGRIRFEAEVDSDEAYLCHCRMCQRASGNVSLAMVGIAQADGALGDRARLVRSSPIAAAAVLRGVRHVARLPL